MKTSVFKRGAGYLGILLLGYLVLVASVGAKADSPKTSNKKAKIQAAMLKATRFMVEKVSYRGGYVWAYKTDFSRRWGELEAKPSMVWVQPPGTPSMGHVFLDAYHATGNEYYYKAAEKTAKALIWGQHVSGGWNYMFDFLGEASLKDWYNTIGRNGWRLEEFHHYYGNATFDDGGTAEASKLLLRLYLEKLDPRYKPALERAIEFVLKSQYPIGGWPQRFPLSYEYSSGGKPDYTSYITFNDDVAMENIEFLLMCYQALGDTRVIDPIIRAMNSVLVTQLGPPQPGWALQYSLDLKPAGARSYEPKALATHATVSSINQLMTFYRLTGESKFLAPIPAAMRWLASLKLAPNMMDEPGRNYPTFVELGTDKPLFIHRSGSNVTNGEYFINYEGSATPTHFSSRRVIALDQLRNRYEQLRDMAVDKLIAQSPLLSKEGSPLPKYFTLRDLEVFDLRANHHAAPTVPVPKGDALNIVESLNAQGFWPSPLRYITNPFIGAGPKAITPGDFRVTRVGDKWDTSPYEPPTPEQGIQLSTYIYNMGTLIKALNRP